MTLFYLIRHGSNDYVPHTLVGRAAGVHLNDAGRREAQWLAGHLAGQGIAAVFSSPLERCRETAEPIANKLELEVRIEPALNEVDFGDWTGRTFSELSELSEWKRWNATRSIGCAPGGESMLAVQQRMVSLVERVRSVFPDARVAMVSHGDPLRTLLLYYLGMPLDLIQRIEVGLGSVSVLAVSDWGAQLRSLNARFGAEQYGNPELRM
jgi:broad specificity phosphatase PhoE